MTALAKLDALISKCSAYEDHNRMTAYWRPAFVSLRYELTELRAELGGVETEQSIAADCYHWIAECIGTLPGYSVQEHVQTMKETLDACSDFLHDFVPSDEGGCDEAVELARNCRAVLSGRIDQYEPTPRAAEAVTEEMVERALAAFQSKPILQRSNESWQTAMRAALTAALTPPSAKGE